MIENRTTTRLPLTQTTTDGERRLSYSYGTTYDEYARPQIRSEQNSYARFSQILTYDAYGRPSTDKRTATLSGGASQEMELQHHYAANGTLIELVEMSASTPSTPSTGSGASGASGGLGASVNSLWELKAENARGKLRKCYWAMGSPKNAPMMLWVIWMP